MAGHTYVYRGKLEYPSQADLSYWGDSQENGVIPHRLEAVNSYTALLEKQSKFPPYNMKCRGKPDTT